MATISFIAIIPLGACLDDIVAQVVTGQHERSLLERVTVTRVAGECVQVSARYPSAAGEAEINDAAHRMMTAVRPHPADSLRVRI